MRSERACGVSTSTLCWLVTAAMWMWKVWLGQRSYRGSCSGCMVGREGVWLQGDHLTASSLENFRLGSVSGEFKLVCALPHLGREGEDPIP